MTHTITRRQLLAAPLAFSAAIVLSHQAGQAQSYPARPLRVLVGGAAGSVPDTLARILADGLSPALGQPVLVENRPGAAGTIAINGLIGNDPDGYTLALATMSQAVFNTYLFAKLPYDPLRDLEPVAPIATGAMAIAANPNFPANSFAEFLAIAKSKPEQVFVGTTQAGSPPHVFAHLLSRTTGIKVTFVPYKSGSDGMTGVMRGDVQVFFDAPTIIAPQVKAGTVKVFAVTGHTRETALPSVPTVTELGFPGAEAEAWIGLVAPARTPHSVVARLNQEIVSILNDSAFTDRLATISFVPVISSPEEFRARISEDHMRWGPVIQEAGIRLD
jgi:tripartite-type tricarboxylate transporter receptor subunit TctC